MMKKLTITVEPEVYRNLHQHVGRRRISGFVNDLVKANIRPELNGWASLEEGYAAMAADEAYEREAAEWIESGVGECLEADDVYDAPQKR